MLTHGEEIRAEREQALLEHLQEEARADIMNTLVEDHGHHVNDAVVDILDWMADRLSWPLSDQDIVSYADGLSRKLRTAINARAEELAYEKLADVMREAAESRLPPTE